jgi:glucose/arabinose dehydrogenase
MATRAGQARSTREDLRIDPLQDGDKRYAIPRDNPFVGNPDALPEIWAYGLRNPQRLSWDTEGEHRMLIADIGQR